MRIKKIFAAFLLFAFLFAPAVAQTPKPIRATMSLPITSVGDWALELTRAAEAGSNVRRFFINYLDGDGWDPLPITPYVKIGEWNPGASAGEPAYDHPVPVRDLSRRDPAFTSKITSIAVELKKNGIVAWIVFDDRCSEIEGDYRQFNDVYYGSAQLHPGWASGDTHRAFAGGNKALELNPYRETLEHDVLKIFRDAGHSFVIAEVENEYGWDPGPAYSIEDMLQWYKLRADHLKSAGFDMIVGSARPPIETKIAPFVDVYDQHGIGEAQDIVDHPVPDVPADRLIWNSDGAPNGTGPGASDYGYHNISEDQAASIGAEVKARGARGFCYLAQSQITRGAWDADRIDNRPTKAASLAAGWIPTPPPVDVEVCAASGLLPNQYCPTKEIRSFPAGSEPTETCFVHKAPEPPPPDHSCLYWLLRLNFTRFFKCIFSK